MKLVEASLRRFRSIVDCRGVEIDRQITCLVGPNGVGKTALLLALQRSRPADGADAPVFRLTADYPAHLTPELLDSPGPIEVTRLRYRLEAGDVAAVTARLGEDVLTADTVTVTHFYGTTEDVWQIAVDELAVVRNLQRRLHDVPVTVDVALQSQASVAGVTELLSNSVVATATTAEVLSAVSSWPRGRADLAAAEVLSDRVPEFLLIDGADAVPDLTPVRSILRPRVSTAAWRARRAVRALFELAGVKVDDLLLTEGRDHLLRDLQRAADAVTACVSTCWPEFGQHAVVLDVVDERDRFEGRPENGYPFLRLQVRHGASGRTTPPAEADRGFVWLFTAMCRVLEAEAERPLVILLDEPGPGLDGLRQIALRRFLEDRLAGRHQVVFATQSPQLAGAGPLAGIRVLRDDGAGTVVDNDVVTAGVQASSPVAGAVAAQLSRTLFTTDDLLLVGSVSDCVFLQFLSSACHERGQEGLDDRWTLAPVGGATTLPLFLSLLHEQPARAVPLLDSRSRWPASSGPAGGAPAAAGLQPVALAQVLGVEEADVEDLFTAEFYLELVNRAYGRALRAAPLRPDDLPEGLRLVQRVESALRRRWISGRIDRMAAASALMRGRTPLVQTLDVVTLERAGALFQALNRALP